MVSCLIVLSLSCGVSIWYQARLSLIVNGCHRESKVIKSNPLKTVLPIRGIRVDWFFYFGSLVPLNPTSKIESNYAKQSSISMVTKRINKCLKLNNKMKQQ